MDNNTNNVSKSEIVQKFNEKLAAASGSSKEKTKTEPVNEDILSLKKQIENLKAENLSIKTIRALEKSGCIMPELAAKAVPADCENLQQWIDTFKSENEVLFQPPAQNHGGNFKPTKCNNLSPTELMNNYIRGI